MLSMMPDTASETFSDLMLLIFRINGALFSVTDKLTAPMGQTSARLQVMTVTDARPLSVAHIARMLGLARQSVQRTADLMVQGGLATYEDNPEHRRAKLLRLTLEGQTVLSAVEIGQSAWANRVGEAFSPDDLAHLTSLLARLLDALEQTKIR